MALLEMWLVYGPQIIVITLLEAFGSLWHVLIEAVSNVRFRVYAPILDWKMDTFSFSSLYPLYLVFYSYIGCLMNELELVYRKD